MLGPQSSLRVERTGRLTTLQGNKMVNLVRDFAAHSVLRLKRIEEAPQCPPFQHDTRTRGSVFEIDRQLVASGWVIQDRDAINLTAGLGVARRRKDIPREL